MNSTTTNKTFFLSYAHEDEHLLRKTIDILERNQLNVNWDHQIPFSKNWSEELSKLMSEADGIIVVWTENSIKSDFVKYEADYGLMSDILLQMCVDGVSPPSQFNSVQTLNLNSKSLEKDIKIELIKDWIEQVDPHTGFKTAPNVRRSQLKKSFNSLPKYLNPAAKPKSREQNKQLDNLNDGLYSIRKSLIDSMQHINSAKDLRKHVDQSIQCLDNLIGQIENLEDYLDVRKILVFESDTRRLKLTRKQLKWFKVTHLRFSWAELGYKIGCGLPISWFIATMIAGFFELGLEVTYIIILIMILSFLYKEYLE